MQLTLNYSSILFKGATNPKIKIVLCLPFLLFYNQYGFGVSFGNVSRHDDYLFL